MWLYRKKGSTFSTRDFTYQFDDDTMKAIQSGWGSVQSDKNEVSLWRPHFYNQFTASALLHKGGWITV